MDLIAKPALSNDDTKSMERLIIGQSSIPQLCQGIKGYITTSNLYDVYTRVETVKKSPMRHATPVGGIHYFSF